MPKKPVDLEAVCRADAKLAKALEDYPELREPNPGRQEALETWLEDLEKDEDHGEAR